MKNIDIKANNLLQQYKIILESDTFTETDILGFLILIREYIDKGKYNQIYDMCDFIAHRFRNDGIIVRNLNNAIKNQYAVNKKRKLKEVNGIDIDNIACKWIELCSEMNITINKKIALEIMIIYASLLQFSSYQLDNGKKGIVELFEGAHNELVVCIKENNTEAPMICFMKFPQYKFVHETYYGFVYDTLHVERIDGELIFLNDSNEEFVKLKGSD